MGKEPAAPHARHVDCPGNAVKVPAPHARQAAADHCPVSALKVPTPHAAHADWPAPLYVPAGQSKQYELPVEAVYCPALHDTQDAAESAAAAELKVPARHGVHAEPAASE